MVLGNILGGLGRGLEAFGSGLAGREDPFVAEEERKQLGNILAGQTIPAFARAGGAEPSTPEQIQQAQLAQLATLGTPQALDVLGQLSPLAQRSAVAPTAPSAVREFEFLQTLSPEKRREFVDLKRADPLRAKGLVETATGEVKVQPGFERSITSIGRAQERARLETRKEIEPSIAEAINAAKIIGTQKGTKLVELKERLAGFPQLEKVVSELSELGKTATFTKAGIARDTFLRETGQDLGEAGITRAQYIAKVDNEILPLLRQTFGAAFTAQEGESLKATLGDVNKSPAEKDAILQSFIDAKIGQIESLQRELGQPVGVPTAGEGQNVFNSVTEAEAANLPKGTQITINGRRAVVE